MDTERRCVVCGGPLVVKKYYDKNGYFKGYGQSFKKQTCSRACTNTFRAGIDPIARFWSHVDQSGGDNACWPWMLSRHRQGYGRLAWDGKQELAHRVAYFLTRGVWPTGDVRHTCDFPPCCNAAHLIDGTTKENVDDMFSKDRHHHRGMANPNVALTEDDVRRIRRLYATGDYSQQAIADVYGVHQTTISSIVHRALWSHVDD